MEVTRSSGGTERPKPFLFPEFCKGCGRCIEACPKHCITVRHEINPADRTDPRRARPRRRATAAACASPPAPSPTASGRSRAPRLRARGSGSAVRPRRRRPEAAKPIPDEYLPLPAVEPLVVKGTYASAIGALLAGCRHFYGYPITPSTEGAELMAKLLPKLDGVFLQAVSEVAAVNMMYGCGGAGLRAMTFTSSPGFSLMLEGISYMIGAELPGVFVNVMRGGPGLGNIAPGAVRHQARLPRSRPRQHPRDRARARPRRRRCSTSRCSPSTSSFKYRNPVVDPRRRLPRPDDRQGRAAAHHASSPGCPDWAVWGDRAHRGNLICSIYLAEADLEAHNRHLNDKYAAMTAAGAARRSATDCDDAEVLLVACNTPARMAKGAVERAARPGRQGRALPPDHPLAVPDRRPAAAARAGAADRRRGGEQRAARGRDAARAQPRRRSPRRPRSTRSGASAAILPQQEEIVEHVSARTEEVTVMSTSSTSDSNGTPTARGSRATPPTTARAAATASPTSTSPRRSTSSASRTAPSRSPRSAAASSSTTTSTSATPRPRTAARPRSPSATRSPTPTRSCQLPGRRRPRLDRPRRDHQHRADGHPDHGDLRQQRDLRHDRRPDGADDPAWASRRAPRPRAGPPSAALPMKMAELIAGLDGPVYVERVALFDAKQRDPRQEGDHARRSSSRSRTAASRSSRSSPSARPTSA